MLAVDVLIVHPQLLFAEVLERALRGAGFHRVTVATSLVELERAIEMDEPDVAVIDGSDASLVSFAGPLPRLLGPHRTRILWIDDGGYNGVADHLAAVGFDGATGVCHSLEDLVDDIITVARGHVVDRRTDRTAAATVGSATRRPNAGRTRLTPRELEVLACLVDGADNRQIAGRLSIRPNTVRTHVQNILMKLGVRSRLEAVSYAVRHGLGPAQVAVVGRRIA